MTVIATLAMLFPSPACERGKPSAQHLAGRGESLPLHREIALGSARCRERATFVSAKVAKTIRAGRDGLADVVSARLPLLLASRAPARTRASLCSNSRALLARSASSLRHRDSAQSSPRHGHPWPALSKIADLSRVPSPESRVPEFAE